MAEFNEIAVLNEIGSTGMAPVFYHKDAEVAKKVVKACYDGGVHAFEFTNRGGSTRGVLAKTVRYATKGCPEVAISIDSITDPATAAMYLQLEANFVTGSLFNPEIAKICNRRLVTYTPGCGSISKVGFVQEVGCDFHKVFPGDVYGTNFVKGLMVPTPWSKLMVTGGVEPSEKNLIAWIRIGVFRVSMGSKLFPNGKVAVEDWAYVAAKCEEVLGYIVEARKE